MRPIIRSQLADAGRWRKRADWLFGGARQPVGAVLRSGSHRYLLPLGYERHGAAFLGFRVVFGICARLRRCPQDLMVVQGAGAGGGFLHVTEWHAGIETAVMNACRDLLLVVPKSA